MSSQNKDKPMHIAMYPWLAMGHLTPSLHLANKLAKLGHKISFFLPTKTQPKLAHHNNYPTLITFIPIDIPPVDGLPPGAETTNDVPSSARAKLMDAMDLTQGVIDTHLARLKPDIVVSDTPEWLPKLAHKHGAKAVYFAVQSLAMFAYCSLNARGLPPDHILTAAEFVEPPPGFQSPNIRLYEHESKAILDIFMRKLGNNGVTFLRKHNIALEQCDAIMFKSCRELEGGYCDFVEKNFCKPVLLVGPVVPEPPSSKLDHFFDDWLSGFGRGSVVFCARGSECFLELDQFQELLLGLELTGRPFLAALAPPAGYKTIESALPEGFAKRTKSRGMVYGGWVQQQLILKHPSIGCFVTHCGPSSVSEAMVNECQIVLIPQQMDQFLNARVLSLELKVGVEVEVEKSNDDGGFIRREAIKKAIESVMDHESEVGREVRANHGKWREFLLRDGLEESYIHSLAQSLQDLLF